MDKFLRNGRGMLFAYDQGMEHGPSDFNERSVDPAYIIKIAGEAGVFTGVIFQKGVAERYYPKPRSSNSTDTNIPPLIIKLNGKSRLYPGQEPYSPLLCTVDEAIQLGASGVGYTAYIGSEYEARMMGTLGEIVRECNQRRIPTIAWMYLRGKSISDPYDEQKVAYAARLALEIGADAVKLQFKVSGDHLADVARLKWIVSNAGKCKVFISGGQKTTDHEVLGLAEVAKAAGAAGLAIGRNIWQRDHPVEFSKQIADILYS